DVLKLGVVYPLPEELLKDFAAQAKKLIVAEELEPYIETHCRAIGIETLGKERLTLQGELTPAMLRERFADILPAGEAPQAVSAVTAEPAPPRPPALCAGCPHRGAFYVLGKLKLHVMGDIGCYTLGAMPPSSAIDACVCMGASIGMAHGMDKARGAQFAAKTVAVLGDSTFIHSGITGLIDIVYNKGVSTVIILDNSITGMTGHQQNPATGITIKGEKTRQIDLKKLCEAVGVERVRVCDPFDLKDFEKVVLEETAAAEPSVIIAQRPCILLKGVRRAAPCYIDREKCKKCMSCLRLGCPAIVRKPEGPSINESMCVGCGLCARLCAFGAICGRGE
ncbi:MAG: thiamine pyrophosphate-dependent enzyme, partial [Clostridia bacterium]|nr:thiamine pyrophosphate-dependent enzyme [Clostridia bacterium]